MKREDFIAKARQVARIDPVDESGDMMADDVIVQEIAALADENDRLEDEVAKLRKQYADAFFSQSQPKEPEDEPDDEPDEIKIEDYLDI